MIRLLVVDFGMRIDETRNCAYEDEIINVEWKKSYPPRASKYNGRVERSVLILYFRIPHVHPDTQKE